MTESICLKPALKALDTCIATADGRTQGELEAARRYLLAASEEEPNLAKLIRITRLLSEAAERLRDADADFTADEVEDAATELLEACESIAKEGPANVS